MVKINLGCGYKLLKGYVNVDCVKNKGVDKIMDLDNYPWGFRANSVDEIYCDNILEHLDFAQSVREIHRILRKGGVAIIKVPYFSNPGAFFSDHKCFFNFDSYNKYCKNMNPGMDLSEPYFDLIDRKITFLYQYKKGIVKLFAFLYYLLPTLCYSIHPKIYIWFLSYIFPASEIHWTLKKT